MNMTNEEENKRFTSKNDYLKKQLVLKNTVECIDCDVPYWEINSSKTGTQTIAGSAINKFFDYEETGLDPEDINKLKSEIERLKSELEQSVKLPCRVGDVIWWINGKILMESEVVSFCIDEDGVSIIHIKYLYDKEKDRWYGHNLDNLDFGKTVFLSQEEAEQYLKGKVE